VLCVVIPFVFCLVTRRPPAPPLFPYTTLFRSKRLGLGFNDAVRQVAERVGVEIPEPGRRSGDERHRPLYEAVAFAADFFRRQLRSEEHTSELQSRENLVCRLLLEKKKKHQQYS